MKKIILIAALALGFAVAATAGNPIEKKFGGKSRALGLRGGYGVAVGFDFNSATAGHSSEYILVTETSSMYQVSIQHSQLATDSNLNTA